MLSGCCLSSNNHEVFSQHLQGRFCVFIFLPHFCAFLSEKADLCLHVSISFLRVVSSGLSRLKFFLVQLVARSLERTINRLSIAHQMLRLITCFQVTPRVGDKNYSCSPLNLLATRFECASFVINVEMSVLETAFHG